MQSSHSFPISPRALAADALRLTFFRATGQGRPPSSWGLALLLMGIDLAIPVAAAFAAVGIHGHWYWYSLFSSVFHIPLLLGAAIVAAIAIRRPEEVARLLVAGLLVGIVLDIAWAVSTVAFGNFAMSAYMNGVQWIPAGWLALALATFACRSVEPGARRLAILVAAAVLVAYPLATTYRDRAFWHTPFNEDDEGGGRDPFGAAAEAAFYKQPQLLAQELRSVRAGPDRRINVFFVGMAGYGGQDVFRKEVESVAALFRDRFEAGGHTVRLINSNRTVLDVPVASATSLRAALRRVGQVMDKQRDVLVLYMTSHGSKDHEFSLSLFPLSFERLDPAVLRAALDESGIRNRVVIVSACYSGGFVKPLANADTLVITAAAADRTSFGCSNEADWTYFGKAYFDEALRHTHSFVGAFEMARPRIAQRETEGHIAPSEPQISVGANIRTKLAQLSDQLDGRIVDVSDSAPEAAEPAPDLYAEYVDMVYRGDYLRDLEQTCRANMQANGPDEALAKFPDQFNGMEKSRRHWRRLTDAWSAYGDEFCRRSLDPHVMRSMYEQKVRSLMSEADLVPVVRFLRSRDGGHWLSLDHEATRQQEAQLGRVQATLSDELYGKYLRERDRIVEDYQKGK